MFSASQEDMSIMEDEEEYPVSQSTTHINSTSQAHSSQPSRRSRGSQLQTALSKAFFTTVYHFKRHAGAGVMASVAYFDPGNWSVDLQAGSDFGYKLLFVILLAGLIAIVLQVLAGRLGCVTGLDLASHCRVLLHDHPRHPRLVRRLVLYPLYVLAELAIIATDLAELLGSAIAINLIFPSVPLWAGVLLTSLDVFVILAISDGEKGKPARLFELIIVFLVLVVFGCFIVLIVKVNPQWGEVFQGFLPSKTLVKPSALYTSIGILGATVMPHALFLGSALGTLDRVGGPSVSLPVNVPPSESRYRRFIKYVRSWFYLSGYVEEGAPDRTTRHENRNNNSYEFVSAHLNHGMVDIIMSLSFFAIPINSAILILAGAVFFFGGSETNLDDSAGLFNVHDLIREKLGKAAALLFAFALLAAGQSASITATLSGQIVSEGFLEWKVSPFVRRVVTRLLGLVPSALVAALIGRNGIDQLLIASQVALSIVLPFVVFPLVYLTSSHVVMTVKVPLEPSLHSTTSSETGKSPIVVPVKEIDYRNNKLVMCLGYLLFCLIVAANVYALITL